MSVEENCALLGENAGAEMQINKGDSGRATTTTATQAADSVTAEELAPAIQNPTGATTTSSAASVPEQAQARMAGPLQQEDAVLEAQTQRSSSVRVRPPDECVEHLFPHIAETHRQIRAAIAGVGEGAFQQKMIKAVKQYISGCRDEFDDATASTLKCRKLARSLSRTLDLIHGVCTTFSDSYEYMHRMSELVALYISCELSYAKEFKEYKPLIANRISNVIYKHLKVPNEDATKANILRMFVYMPGMYKEREVMTKIFKKFITNPQFTEQQELPDKIYIQYLIAFYQWKQMEVDFEEQLRVIEFANRFMRPAKTLCTNATYAYHLPKYDSRRTATKYILQNLKFFQDLRNASIYDNCLKSATCVVDLSDDDPVERTSYTCPPFAEIVANTKIDPVHKSVKFEEQIILATVDLTLEDSEPALDADTVWLKLLRERALKLAPTECLLVTARQAATGAQTLEPEVIDLDSDSEDETQAASGDPMNNEPELFSSDFEEPERMDAGPDCYNDVSLLDNIVNDSYRDDLTLDNDNQDDDVDPTKTTCQFPTDLRTYVTSKRPSSVLPSDKISQTKSPPASLSQRITESRSSAATSGANSVSDNGFSTPIVTSFPMPFIVDSFSCRRDSIHLLSTPLAKGKSAALDESMQTSGNKTLPEENTEEDEEFRLFLTDSSADNATNNAAAEKVIFSQVTQRRSLPPSQNFADYSATGINAKQCDRVKQNQSKKQVKFNETPIGPTRLSPSTTVKFPIKPAINVNKYNNPQTRISSTPLPRFCCSSPASSSTTSSSICSEYIKQMAQKGMTDTSITTVESNIEIAPIDAKSITEAIVSTQPTIEGATKITNVNLSKMNLSILIDDKNLNTKVLKKDVEQINTVDISSTNCNELIVVEDDAKVDVEVANLDVSERVCSSSVDSVETKSVCEVGETSRVLNNMKKDPIAYDQTILSDSLSSINELICIGFNKHKVVTTKTKFANEIGELVEKRPTSTKNIDRVLKGNIRDKSPTKRVTAAECAVDMTVVSSTIDDTQYQSTNKENECTIDCRTFNVDTLQSKCAIPAAMQQGSSQSVDYNHGKNETKENATLETNAVLLAAEKPATVKYIKEDFNISSSIAAEDTRLDVTEKVSSQVADNAHGQSEAKEIVTGETVATNMLSPVNNITQITEEESNISSSNIQIDTTEEAMEEIADHMHDENDTKEIAIIKDFAPSLPVDIPASGKNTAKDTEEENVAEDTAEESNITSLNVEQATKECTQNTSDNSDGKMWSSESCASLYDPILDKSKQSLQHLLNTPAIERKDAVHEKQPADISLTALKTTTDPVRIKSQTLASPKVQIQSIEIIPPNEQKWVISKNTVLKGHLKNDEDTETVAKSLKTEIENFGFHIKLAKASNVKAKTVNTRGLPDPDLNVASKQQEHVTVEDEKAKDFLSLSNWGKSLKENGTIKPHSSEFTRELLQSESNSTHASEVETAAHELCEDLKNVVNEDVHEDYRQVPVIEQIDFEDLIIAKRVNIPKRKHQELSPCETNELNHIKPQDKAVDTAGFEVMLTNATDLVTAEQKYIPEETNIENTDNKILEEDEAEKTFVYTKAHEKKPYTKMFLDNKTTAKITPTKNIDINKKERKLNIDNSTTKISINNKCINKIVHKEERKTGTGKATTEFSANNKTTGEKVSISKTDIFMVEHKEKLDDPEANIYLQNKRTSTNIDDLTVEDKKKTQDAKSKISIDNKTSEFPNETLALNLGCQQDTGTPLTELSATENKSNYKLNTPESVLSTTLNTKTIGNNDLDSDLEFDFDFVFGLDFDSLTSGSTATTELSNEAVGPNATIAKEFEADKLLEALNKPPEMPVENALASESCRQQPTTKSTPLNTYVMCSPSLSSTTSSSTSSGSSCSCSSCISSSSSSSSTSSTSTGSEKSQHPIALPDNLNVLPIELANDLLVLNDTELLPAAELLDDTAELLKEFVPIPTLETSSENVNSKPDNNTIKDVPKICPPLEDDYELNNIMLDDESQLDEDEITWQQEDLEKNSATVGAFAEEVSHVNDAALEASPKKSDVPQTTRAEFDIRKSKAVEINISVEPSISQKTPSLLVSIPRNNIQNFKGTFSEKVGLYANADDDDKPSTSRAALLALAKKNFTSIAVTAGVERMECATMRKRSISELKFAESRTDAYDTTICNALEENDIPIARQALLRDIGNYSPDPDNLQLDITLPLKKRRKLSEFQEDDPLNFTVPMTEDDDTIMEEITRITISHHVTEADSTEGNTNENTQLFMQLVANKLSTIIAKSKPEKSKDTAAPAQSMTDTNTRKPPKPIVELKQQELIDSVMLPIAQNVVVTCEADSSVSNMNICAEGAGYTTPLTKRTSPRYRVQPPVQIVPPQLKGQLGNAVKERELVVGRCAPLPASYPATPMFSVANFEKLVRLQRYIDMLMASVDVTLVIASATANGLVVNEHMYEETRAAILEQATIISSDGNGVLKPLLLKQHADGSVSILNDNDDGNEWLILPASTAKQLQKVSTAMALLQQQQIAATGQDSNIKADIEMILSQLSQKGRTSQMVNNGAGYIPSQQTDLVKPLIGPEAFGLEKINTDDCPTTLASVGQLQQTELAAYGLNTTEMTEENAEQSVRNVNMAEIGIEEMLINSGAPTMSRLSNAFVGHSEIVPPQPQSQLRVELPAKGAIATLASQQQFAQNKDNATLAMLTGKSEPTVRQNQKLKQNCMLKHQSVASKEADAATYNKSKQFASLNVLKQYVSYMRQQQTQINQHLSRVKASIARNKTPPVKAVAHVAKVTDRNACTSDRACYSQSAFNPINVASPSASSVSMQKLSQNANAHQHMQHFSASGTANTSRNNEQSTRMSHSQHLPPASALQLYVTPAEVVRQEESALETIDISQLKMPYQKTTTRNTLPAAFYKNLATERQSQRAELHIEELKRKHLTQLRQQEMQSRNKQLELEKKLQLLREQQRRKKQEIHLQEQEERRQQQLQQQQYAHYQLQHEAYAGMQHQQQMQAAPPPRRRGRPRKNSVTPAPVGKRTYATRSKRAANNASMNTLHSSAAITPSLGNFSAPMASNNFDLDAEHIEAIATVFSSYDIFREPQMSTTRTTAPATKRLPKRTHLSRKTFKSTPQQKRLSHACDLSPTSPRASDTSVSPSSARMRSATGKSLSPLARVAGDPKLNAKCLVVIERNEEIEREEIAYINQLLELQREQQRQRALSRQQRWRDARVETNVTISKRTTPAARSSVDTMPTATSEVQEPSPIRTHNERPSGLSNSSVEETERLNSESPRRVSVSPQCEKGDACIPIMSPTKQFKVRLKRSKTRGDGETRWIMVNTSRNHATQNKDANTNTIPEIISSKVMSEAENAVVDRELEKNASKTVEIVQEQEYGNEACNKEPLQEMTAKTAAKNESTYSKTGENKNLTPSHKNKEITNKRTKLRQRSLALNAAGVRKKRVKKKTESAINIEQNGKDTASETLLEENKEESLFLEKAKKALNRLKQNLLAMDVSNAVRDSPEKLLSPPPQEQEKKQNQGEKQPVQKKPAKFRKKKGQATTPTVTAISTEENNLNTLKESMSKKVEAPAANKNTSTAEPPTTDNLEGRQSGNCENVFESSPSYPEDMEPPEVAATEIVVTQTEHQEHQQQLDCAPPACSAVETTIQAAAIEAAAAEVPPKYNNSLCIYSKTPNQIELMTEIAAAATSLTLLANTAASTAPIPPKPNTGKSKETPAATIKPPAQASNAMEEQPPPALTKEAATIPTADTLLTVEVADIVSVTAVNVSQFKEAAMSFLNLEATPTVPAYLFNGESRDVPTPTLAVGTAVVVEPTAVDGDLTFVQSQSHISVDSSSVTLESNTEQLLVSSVLSTSDHEVSSTQETVFEAPKRTMNAQPKQVESLSIMPDTVLLMQDNQVDTTNHLPESSYNMRRRTRKLSTHDEISAEPFHHRPVHKRRKTFCAESALQFMTAPEPFRHSSSGTSPSTTSNITTLNQEKQSQRRRGRPLKNAALVAASLSNVTSRQKLQQHGFSATSVSSAAVAVGYAIDNSALRKGDSPGGGLPVLNVVEIENCLDVGVKTSGVLVCPPPVEKQPDVHKPKKRKHNATLNGAKIKVLDRSAKAEKPQRRVIAAPSKVSVAPKRK